MNNFDYPYNNNTSKFNGFDINSSSYAVVYGTVYSVLFEKGQKWTPESKDQIASVSTAVSHCLFQIAKKRKKKHLKIGNVVGICNSKSFEYNKMTEFDHLIPYDEPNELDKIHSFIKETFFGGRFVLIFDSVGTFRFFPIIETVIKPTSENSYYLTFAGKYKLKYKPGQLKSINRVPLLVNTKPFNPWRSFIYDFITLLSRPDYLELATDMASKKEFIPSLDSLFNFENFQNALDRNE